LAEVIRPTPGPSPKKKHRQKPRGHMGGGGTPPVLGGKAFPRIHHSGGLRTEAGRGGGGLARTFGGGDPTPKAGKGTKLRGGRGGFFHPWEKTGGRGGLVWIWGKGWGGEKKTGGAPFLPGCP